MSLYAKNHRFGRLGTLTAATIGLAALALPLAPANAQYLGFDLGNGVSIISIGTPPSAYGYYRYAYSPYYYSRLHFYRPYSYLW